MISDKINLVLSLINFGIAIFSENFFPALAGAGEIKTEQ